MGKKTLKALVTIFFIVVATIPFLYWNKKNNIQNRFDDIEFRIHQSNSVEWIFHHCDTVSRFISDNPIHIEVELNCGNYEVIDSARIESLRNDFIAKVQEIDNDYRRQERVANRWMFIILILSHILGAIARRLIDKYSGDTMKHVGK